MQRASIRVTGKLLLALVFLPIVTSGQIPGGITAPTSGFLFDVDARAFRPILGFIGSSALGNPIDIERPITFGFSLPDNRHALAVFEEGNSLTYLDFVARPFEMHAIPGTITGITSYSISPNGKTVILVDSAHQRLQVISEFPSSPSLALEISAPSLPQGKLLRAVVNDAATAMLVTVSNSESETIYRWNRSTGFESLTALSWCRKPYVY
jgi:hypothetical protein